MNRYCVAIIKGHMVRLFVTKTKIEEIFQNGKIDEYRICESKKQADYFCKKYNKMEDFKNEEI